MSWRGRVLVVAAALVASCAWHLGHTATASAAPCDSDVAYGEVVTCNMTASQVRDMTFPGTVNDRVRVRVVPTSGALNPLTSVRFGSGDVCAPTFADEFTCQLTATGVQTLRVNANGSGAGSFVATIQRLNNPSACPALTFGPTGKVGAINQNAEIDCLAPAAATVGQRYRARLVETSGSGTLIMEVVRPDGTTVCGPTSASDLGCAIDTAGVNRIYVYASGGLTTANYRIVLEKFPNPTGCTALDYGDRPSVTFDDAGELACYTFTGSTGDRIRERTIQTTGALNPLTEVLRPDGTTVCPATFADDQTCTLDTNGKQTMLVYDGVGTGADLGTAELAIQRLNNPSACPALTFGPTGKVGAINQNAEIDCLAPAAATVGQRYRARLVETSGSGTLIMEVVRPDGTTVCGPTSASDLGCAIDTAGVNRIYVYASGGLTTANYRIVLEKFPNPTGCTALDYGDRPSVTFDDAGELACYTFTGSTGDRIRERTIQTTGALNPLTEVLRPDGTTVCPATFADDQTCTLDTNGKQTMLVYDGVGTGADLGTAELAIQRLNNPSACPALTFGPTGKVGAINQNAEIDCLAPAAATVGQRYRARLVETSGSGTLIMEVVRPDGTTVCGPTSASDLGCAIDTAGVNRIYVYASGGLTTANYRIVLEKFPNPTGCTALDYGDRPSVTFDDAGELACYTFTGSTGDRIRERTIQTTGALNPLTEVLRPDGTTVCPATFADDQTCTLDTNGKQTMLVYDGVGTGADLGTAELAIQRLNNPSACPALTFGPTGKVGAINQNAEIDCLAPAAATVGQRYRARLVETSGSGTLIMEVVRPDGTTVCGPTSASDLGCAIDTAGVNRIYVYASGGLTTANYRIVLEKFPNPTGCTALDYGDRPSVTFDDAGELACYTFTGSTGDRIRERTIQTTGALNPLTEVLRPDGTTVCPATFADDQTCTLDTNGKQTMLVYDGVGTGADLGTAELAIQRLNNPSACPALTFGPTGKVGAINQNAEIDCLAPAAATVGQRYRARLVETSGSGTLIMEVVRPDGTTVCGPTSASDLGCAIDTAGVNRIYVYASGGLTTANYRIVLEKFPNPTGCTAKTIGDPAETRPIDDPGELDCVTFTGSASQDVRIVTTALSGTLNPLTEVLRPDGSTVCPATFSDDFVCDLDANGKFTVLVYDGVGTGADTGTYSLRLLDPP